MRQLYHPAASSFCLSNRQGLCDQVLGLDGQTNALKEAVAEGERRQGRRRGVVQFSAEGGRRRRSRWRSKRWSTRSDDVGANDTSKVSGVRGLEARGGSYNVGVRLGF
jgi:hypothetical protein